MDNETLTLTEYFQADLHLKLRQHFDLLLATRTRRTLEQLLEQHGGQFTIGEAGDVSPEQLVKALRGI